MSDRRDLPLVSALIANHDYGHYVVEAVHSVLLQTYPHIEIVVVDDASSDDSVERLRRTFGERIRLVELEQNVGQVRAIEAGFAETSGEVICLLDADDRWLPDKVQRVVDVMADRPELTQVSHDLRSIDGGGAPISRDRTRFPRRLGRHMPLNEGDVRRQLFRWNRYGYAITSGLSYPRWVLEAMTPMPAEFEGRSTYFDTWATVAAAFLGPVGRVDEVLMDYRVHGANAAGGSVDFGRFLSCWTTTGRLVDHWARRTGDPRRSDVGTRDNRITVFGYLNGTPVPLRRRLRAVLATPVEMLDIGADAVESVISTCERLVMSCSRSQGAEVKRLGFRRWARAFAAQLVRRTA